MAVSSVFRGYFNGIEKISTTANSQSIEQILKTILTIGIVEFFCKISSQNTVVMAAGAAIATTVSTFLSFGYLYILYIKNKKEIWKSVLTSTSRERESVSKIIKSILYLSVPIAFTSLLSAANRTIDAFSIINIVSRYMEKEKAKFQYGILTGKVEGLVILPYSFNIAFATTLIPTISAAKARGEMNKALKRINFSIMATILICLPCAAVLFCFAEPILKLLFPNAYLGKTMLKICSIGIVFVAVTQTIDGVLQGIKKVKEPVIAIGVGAIVKLILNLILLPIEKLNINGAIIATIASHIVTFGISFYYLKKYVKLRINLVKFIVKPVIATAAMIMTSWNIYEKVNVFTSKNLNLILSLIIGGCIYIISIILLRILSKEEIYMLPYVNKLYKTREKKKDFS